MTFARNMQRLLRHQRFRRLVAIRSLTQCADGSLQIGMASHILFNPAQQPNAWAIAAMFAITLLPFSIVGPFVSGLLDHWSRRTVTVVVDATRCLLALVIAGIVASGSSAAGVATVLFGCLMVALALNRFVLAGLAAGMQHTIDDDEFLTASAVMPMIGPVGLLVGGGLAGAIRLGAPLVPALADALIFCCAAAMWAGSSLVALRMGRLDLGPLVPAPHTSFGQTLAALRDAGTHLARRRPALLGLATITCQRVLYGLTLVAVLVLFRNHLHGPDDVAGAMTDIGLWMGASGVGFALSVGLVPPVAHRLGMRRTVVALLLASAVVQLGPGQVLQRWPLVASSLLLGWFAQSVKICIDTVVQAHVDGELKGRVFVLYDGLFNAAIVLAAVLAALVIPDDGVAHALMVAIGIGYVVLATAFWLLSRPMGSEAFNRGTELAMKPAAATD